MLLFCIVLYVAKILIRSPVFDIEISRWPPVSVHTQLSSRGSEWLVTNNCKVIPLVPIKKDLQWKNSQPRNETVVSWCLIRKRLKHSPLTQSKHLL